MFNSATRCYIIIYTFGHTLHLLPFRLLYIMQEKSWYRRKNTYNKKWLQKNNSDFFNYKLYCIICRNGCCTYYGLSWLLPHHNTKIFLFIFNIGGRHSWIFVAKSAIFQRFSCSKADKTERAAVFAAICAPYYIFIVSSPIVPYIIAVALDPADFNEVILWMKTQIPKS